ncbi:MAG: lytic murein transglycosylase B [Gammaproteobacteria bacterium]
MNLAAKKYRRAACALACLLACGRAAALDIEAHPPLLELIEVMVAEDGYPRAELEAALRAAKLDPSVIRKIKSPHEDLPWHKYRSLFITQERIHGGAAFWAKQEETLARATGTYGVPADVIVALLGVETNFGARRGNTRVLDALVTLTVDYPRRRAFFGGELRAFLNTTRDEGIDPSELLGSYAGALGIPQFMPTSYRAYAVDFNDNGRRDLFIETADAIGSVGNYLKVHGWVGGQAILREVRQEIPPAAAALVGTRAKPRLSAAELAAAGIRVDANGGSAKMALLALQEADGARHIVGFGNFYALTRYNPSVHYAMAVVELAREIRRLREK